MSSSAKCGVIFDLDGTLTNKGPSVWATIDKHAVSDECRGTLDRLRERYLKPAIDGTLSTQGEMDWLIRTLDAYVDDGLTSDGMDQALQDVRLRAGVIDCLNLLEAHGVPVAVVSYGVAQAISGILAGNGLSSGHSLFGAIFAARLTGVKQEVRTVYTGYDIASLVIPSNKGGWSRNFALRHGIDPEDLLAVGDSGGDRFLCEKKSNRLGLAGDPAEAAKLQRFMGTVVVTDGFAPVTEWLKIRLGL